VCGTDLNGFFYHHVFGFCEAERKAPTQRIPIVIAIAVPSLALQICCRHSNILCDYLLSIARSLSKTEKKKKKEKKKTFS